MSTIFTVTLPDIGEGVVEGEVIEWLKEVGSTVKQDEPVVVVMTDKATVELPAPHPGIIAKHYQKPGEHARLGKPLYDIEVVGEVKQTSKPAPVASEQTVKHEPSMQAKGVNALPKTRRLAEELSINLADVTATGKEGRIEPDDLRKFLENQRPIRKFEGDRDVPLIGIRGLMAKKMAESNRDIPHFSFFEQADAVRLIQLRVNVAKAAAQADIHLTYMPFFIRALSLTIKQFPEMNCSFQKTHLIVHKPHNIGIAISTPRGLIVPVLKNVDQMNIEQIIRAYDLLIKKAKDNKLESSDMHDGTITLSNYGVLGGGGRWATPIINAPEVAILGLARIFKAPVIINDEVVAREVLNLSWSFDHRVLDGSMGAQISHFYAQLIQNPASLL